MLFTCKALVLAERISVIETPLVNYRMAQESNSQSTNHLYPLDFYKAFSELKKWLVKNKIFNEVKKSFIEWVIAGCVVNIKSINNEACKQLVKKKVLKKGMKEFCLYEHNNNPIFELEYHQIFNDMLNDFKNKEFEQKKKIRNFFSMRNSEDKRHKIVTILGIKIKIKRMGR